MNLKDLLAELPAIAERADRERLSALWPIFEKEFPNLATEFEYCASIEDSQTVVKYLLERIPMLQFIRLTTPKFDDTIIFIHQFMKEKFQNGRTDQNRDRKHLRP
jgi:hypothetical protein